MFTDFLEKHRPIIKHFLMNFSPILAQLEQSYSEVIIAFDFNINLLDIKTKDKVLTFYIYFTTIGFLPEITLPTRFSQDRYTYRQLSLQIFRYIFKI